MSLPATRRMPAPAQTARTRRPWPGRPAAPGYKARHCRGRPSRRPTAAPTSATATSNTMPMLPPRAAPGLRSTAARSEAPPVSCVAIIGSNCPHARSSSLPECPSRGRPRKGFAGNEAENQRESACAAASPAPVTSAAAWSCSIGIVRSMSVLLKHAPASEYAPCGSAKAAGPVNARRRSTRAFNSPFTKEMLWPRDLAATAAQNVNALLVLRWANTAAAVN